MLQVNDISKRFGNLTVLDGVSLTVGEGEVIGITGPSGAGKSTLLHIMGTLDLPDSGEILFRKKPLTGLRDKELSRFRNESLGFVFQSHQLLPEFSLLENVMMPALIGGSSWSKAKDRAMQLIDEVGLTQRTDHRPAQLSGGECQRGAVARALINSPAIVLADEPTGNLDSANSTEISRLFFTLRDNHGTAFVVVTHDEKLAARCDRTLHLVDGKITDRK